VPCLGGHRSLWNRVCYPFPPLPLGPGPGPGFRQNSVGGSGWFECSECPARFVRFQGLGWFQQIVAIERHPLRKLKSIAVVRMFRERKLDSRWPKRNSSYGLASFNLAFNFHR